MNRIRLSPCLLVFLLGCSKQPTNTPIVDSDLEQVRAADFSILFIGNSHTGMHDLPKLVSDMIRSRFPDKNVYAHYMPVAFLEEVAKNPSFNQQIETRSWKFVVLQAQKISASGKFEYPRQEGIDFAKLAREKGADVLFFSEWGLKGVEGDGVRQQKIYQEMADAAGVRVAPISRAWDIALAERPDMPLHAGDGNHQSATGAFLTACVFFGAITGESPAGLAEFQYAEVNEADRKFLAGVAARTLAR